MLEFLISLAILNGTCYFHEASSCWPGSFTYWRIYIYIYINKIIYTIYKLFIFVYK